MELLVVAGAYVAGVLLFVFIMLFGESELFARTPVSWAHWVITSGACQGVEWTAGRLCGRRGRSCLDRLEAACCERSNPVVQVLFLALLSGSFLLFAREFFTLLPLPGVPAWHVYTGTAAAAACLAAFVAASVADPGAITPQNAEAHRALYPCDGLLFEEGAYCWTCGVPKPARSKHCKSCGRCIARFDHHCIWTNNCIGLLNTRWFLLFLLSTTGAAAYGAVLGALCIRADMARRDAWSHAWVDRGTGRLVYVGDGWQPAAHYMAAAYPTELALVMFLGLAAWIVFGFGCYQVFRILQGVTTNESFKRRDYLRALRLQRELDAQRAKQDAITDRILGGSSGSGDAGAAGPGAAAGPSAGAAGDGGSSRGPGTLSQQHGGRRGEQAQQAQQQERLPNPYNRGAWRNLHEVLFPWHHLRTAQAHGQALGALHKDE